MLRPLQLLLTVLTFFGLISAVSADLDSGLVRYMKFEEGSGDSTYDSSGYGDNGTCSVYHRDTSYNPWTSNGYFGGGIQSNGIGSFFDSTGTEIIGEIPHVDHITVSAWIKPDSMVSDSGNYMVIAAKTRDIYFAPDSTEWCLNLIHDNFNPWWNLSFGIQQNECGDGNPSIRTGIIHYNEWSHIAATYDGDSIKIYINGLQDTAIADKPDSSTICQCGGKFYIGQMKDAINMYYRGIIDEVRVYNRALSGSEILELVCTNHIYVDSAATGNNNGTSWANAYTDLKTALYNAQKGTAIFVSRGTYYPSTNLQTASFNLKPEVCIYGGFSVVNNDTSFNNRDFVNNQTVLSGDIGTPSDSSDNCYHVLIGATNSLIDGFIIKGGSAISSSTNQYGGGMYNYFSQPIVNNCTFINNYAVYGGGMANIGSSPIINKCSFKMNVGTYGSCIVNISGASPNITYSRFEDNFYNLTGGAISNYFGVNLKISRCQFYNNVPKTSGYTYGGAIYARDTCHLYIDNSYFAKNSSARHGGAISTLFKCNTKITNCTFYSNSAALFGGSISNDTSCSLISNNNIFWKNQAYQGGEIWSRVYNSNTRIDFQSSNIEGGWNGYKIYPVSNAQNLGGNINADPLFADTSISNFHLNSTSPCIDAGTNSLSVSNVDLDGNNRITNGTNGETAIIDMGAYEYQP